MAQSQSSYANSIIAKKGALGHVWVAAHMEKKLGKTQIMRVNVADSVGMMVKKESGLALRVSGHLLLGIVRIHARQAEYLLEDAGEAVVKVRLAFKPAPVDLAPEHATRRFDEVTNPTAAPTASALDLDFDFLDAPFEPLELPALGARGDGEPGSAARPARRGSAAGADAADDGARARDLTLADDDGALGLGLGAHHGGRGAEGGAEADAFEFGRDDGAYEHFADAEVETLRDNSAAPRGGLDPDGTFDIPIAEEADGVYRLSLSGQLLGLPAPDGAEDGDGPPPEAEAEPPLEPMGGDEPQQQEEEEARLDDVLGADHLLAAQTTPTVGVDGGAAAAGRRAQGRKRVAPRGSLHVDADTQLGTEEMARWLKDASATVRRAAADDDAADDADADADEADEAEGGGGSAYVRARLAALHGADAAALFAQPIVRGDAEALRAAYAARPYHALAESARRSSAKRRRVSADGEGSGALLPPTPGGAAPDGPDEPPLRDGPEGGALEFGAQDEPPPYDPAEEYVPDDAAEPPPPDGDAAERPEATSYGVSLPTVDGAEEGAEDEEAAPGGARAASWSKRTRMMFGLLRRTFEHAGGAPLSYRALASDTSARGAAGKKRVVAGCFQELLVLASDELISLRQDAPYADLFIAQTDKFGDRAAREGALEQR